MYLCKDVLSICILSPFCRIFCIGWWMRNLKSLLFSFLCTHFCILYWYSRLLLDTLKMNWKFCLMLHVSGLRKVSLYGELFLPGVQCLGHKAEHSPSPIPEVKNACRHLCTSLYAFMACRITTSISVWFWLRQFFGD
jgi:hypothetical protein